MKKLGISCVKCEEQKKFRQEKVKFNLDASKLRMVVE
jgi:hypothetical protein